MRLRWGMIGSGAAVGAAAFLAALWAMGLLWPGIAPKQPAVIAVPPLEAVVRSSLIVAPTSIALTAIRDAIERQAPRELSGKAEMPPLPVVSDIDIGWSVARSPFAITGAADGLSLSATLNGNLRANAQTGRQATGSSDALTGLLDNLLRGMGNAQASRPQGNLDQQASISGRLALRARPTLLPEWRLEPNLTSEIAIADASLSFFGVRLSVPDEVKPLLDGAVNDLVTAAQERLRSNPAFELAMRAEWEKICRSISLQTNAKGMPDLWLELRPTRAFAAQPRIEQQAVMLTVGIQAETRIVPKQTKPECPFPERLEIVPEANRGSVSIALPIDMPFADVSRLLEANLKGKTFPEDQNSAFSVTIRSVRLAASGDRLLISVGVRAHETKTWLGLGTDAVVHVWGRPQLDADRRVLRLESLALDIESAAAFGLLGTAARAAIPSLERALAEHAVIDLAPLKDVARKNLEAALAEFRTRSDGIRIDAELLDLRLAGVEFDARTLRIIAEARGTAGAAITKLAN